MGKTKAKMENRHPVVKGLEQGHRAEQCAECPDSPVTTVLSNRWKLWCACCVAAWEYWQWLSISGDPLSVLSLELHGEDDAQLFDSRFKGVSVYPRSRPGNSHDTSEKWDSKNLQERHLAILILLTNFLKYSAGKIFFPCSMFQNSSLL